MSFPIHREERFVEMNRKKLEDLLFAFNSIAKKARIPREVFREMLKKNDVPKELQQPLERAVYGRSKYVGLGREVPVGNCVGVLDKYFGGWCCLSLTETVGYFSLGLLVKFGAYIYNIIHSIYNAVSTILPFNLYKKKNA
ncbi:hypothetical protein KY307_03545 [Candidatus Woesearchaeota archaeon]|nr:hypothetical protein [Candidatus Woesearchaeota archaeon]